VAQRAGCQPYRLPSVFRKHRNLSPVAGSLLAFTESFRMGRDTGTIKWSLGIQRGKNDSADSVRICTYAFRNQDKALAFSSADDAIGKMADLMALRTRLMTCIGSLKVPIQELRSMGLNDAAKLTAEASKKSISALEKDVTSQ